LRVGRERCHADGHRAAGRRSGRHRWISGTMARVQRLSVWVVVAVQPSDSAHREQHERRQRQMNDGHPKQRGVGAEKLKLISHHCCYCEGGRATHEMPISILLLSDNITIRHSQVKLTKLYIPTTN